MKNNKPKPGFLKRTPCQHEPDWSTTKLADGTADILDVACKHCHTNGSVIVAPEGINWE
jgi:hypothetical protein